MKTENSYKALAVLLAIFFFMSGCQKENSVESPPRATLEIRFIPVINGQPLELNQPYTNPFGETYSLSIFRFYAGRFSLGDQQSGLQKTVEGEPYYLPDLADKNSMQLTMPVEPGIYDELAFILGVDSALNVSGVQSGVLDPARGMFWTWNSGYIFTKIEGNSTASSQPNGKFEYHVGGFKSPFSAIRPMVAQLSGTDKWILGKDQTLHVDIAYDMNSFFDAHFPLRIAENAVVMTPGEQAMNISLNFAGAFEIVDYSIR